MNRRVTWGTRVYALAVLIFGVTQFVWHDFAANWHPIPPEFPLRSIVLYAAASLLVIAGISLLGQRTKRLGLALSAVFFLFASLFWLRRIIHFPTILGTWSGFAEEFAPVVAAVLSFLTSGRGPLSRSSAIRTVGRVLFGLCVVSFGAIHLDALKQTAALVPAWIPMGQTFWAIATGIAFLVFGIAIVVGVASELAARLTAAMLGVFALLVWLPRIVSHPERQNSWAGTAITLAVAGAAWMIAENLHSPDRSGLGTPRPSR